MKKNYLLIIATVLLTVNVWAQPMRNWGTYFGGAGNELGSSVAADINGNVYIAGRTTDTSGVSTAGAFQTVLGGSDDAFLAKFNNAGVLQWATYYGGIGFESSIFVAVDISGNVYLTGSTTSTTMSTVGSYHPYLVGPSDVFLAKFNSSGVRQWATYYGGTNGENPNSIVTDASGSVYITGGTNSIDSIGVLGSHQPTFGGGSFDGFVVKFSNSGLRQWSTYYGGTGEDAGTSLTTDASGNIYLSGVTASTNAISTSGCYQISNAGGTYDAFLVKFNSSGVRQWGTYYGGTADEEQIAVAVDASSNVYMSGYTTSTASISSVGSYQPLLSGVSDAFLTKFNSSGVRQWATYYGGSGGESACAIAADGGGDVYIEGVTSSTAGMATAGSYQTTLDGSADTYFAKFNSAGMRQWSTYYGGTGTDQPATSFPLVSGGSFFVAGYTTSTSAMASAGSYQPIFGGSYDAYVSEFSDCAGAPTQPTSISGTTTVCSGSSNTYSVTAVSGAVSYTWTLPSGWSGTSTTNSITTTAGTTSGNITVTANNACGSSTAQTLAVTVSTPPATPASISGPTTLCSGSSATYSIAGVGGAISYTWTLPGGWTGTSTTSSISATAGPGVGTITVVVNSTCGSSAPASLSVGGITAPLAPTPVSGSTTICSGSSNTYTAAVISGATSYVWTLPGGWSGTSSTNSISTTAGTTGGTISVFANNTCGAGLPASVAVTVNSTPSTPGTISGTTTVCSGSSNTYSITAVSGATSYTWTLPGGWSGTSTTNSITTTAGTTSGNITVAANNTCGNSSAQTLAVIVNTVPSTPGTITGDNSICIGSSNPYSIISVSGATSYTWALPGGWSGASTTNSITATASATSGNVTVTANNTCGNSPAQTLAVTVNPLPIVTYVQSPSLVCVNATAIVLGTVTPSGGTFSGTSVTGSSFNASTAGSGTYPIVYTYTDANGCTNTATSNITVDACTGVQQLAVNNQQLTIYPNPTNSVVTLSGVEVGNIAEVFNVLGKKIYSTKITTDNIEINLSELQSGIYFIRISNEINSITKKIIKE